MPHADLQCVCAKTWVPCGSNTNSYVMTCPRRVKVRGSGLAHLPEGGST